MAANTTPIFTLTPIAAGVVVATANTNLDGSGTIATVVTGATYGTRIDRVVVKAAQTTTAGLVMLFVKAGGGTFYLFEQIQVSAISVGASTVSFAAESTYITAAKPLILPSGYVLGASTYNAETFRVHAIGGNYS